MDKNAIKRYAVWARRELMARVSQKARQYGITAEETVDAGADIVNGRVLSGEEKSRRRELVREVKSKGYEQTIEEAAYTWFNRFIALRFMEVNGCLPTHVRVFTDDEGRFAPQILAEAIDVELEGLDRERVYSLKSADRTEELYQYLLITQCNALNAVLPGMFRSIDDYMELLFPDNLLREGSVVERMISMIPQEDWRDQVQIIGWLYQYYNTEPKDKVFADLKKNIKVSREKIPAATQLFTPDWIVRYMVENSLGRLWVEGHPNEGLKAGWRYYLEEAEQEPEVQAQLEQLRAEYRDLKPEEIKCIDPCMGSGHILVYMFDVLMQIYESCGWSRRDAVRSILEHNLYGLDIDDRAAQLAYFSVMMKAVSYDGRFLRRGDIPQPNVYSPRGYEEGEELGSLLMVDTLEPRPEQAEELTLFDERYEDRLARWNFRRLLAQKYHVVVTNPPYMAVSNMNGKLSDFIKKHYPDYKSDLFSAFFVRCIELANPIGKLGFFSPYVWMFIQSYEKWRNLLCKDKTIETLIQFEYSAFEEATVPVCTFVFSNYFVNKRGCYFRLTDFRGGMEIQRQKTLEAIANHDCGYYFEQSTANFSKIPGSPVAYWVGDAMLSAFEGTKVVDVADTCMGISTGDNSKFLRLWYEVNYKKIGFNRRSTADAISSGAKWFPHHKGGEFRRWYGNNDYIVDWENDGDAIRHFTDGKGYLKSRPQNTQYFFREAITWSLITSSIISFRYRPIGFAFGDAGPAVFPKNVDFDVLFGLLNTKIIREASAIINPTINSSSGVVASFPATKEVPDKDEVCSRVKRNVAISKSDWDSYETSWDFKKHPLI